MKVPHDFDFEQRRVEQYEELEAVAWAENNGWPRWTWLRLRCLRIDLAPRPRDILFSVPKAK